MAIDSSKYVVLDVDVVELDRLAAIHAGGDRDALLRETIRVMAARAPAEGQHVAHTIHPSCLWARNQSAVNFRVASAPRRRPYRRGRA